MKRASHWLATAALLLPACGSGDDARVMIDAAALWGYHAQVTDGGVDLVYVRVFDELGALQLEQSFARDQTEFDLTVPAGPSRFEVEALGGPSSLPQLWGDELADLAPQADVTLVIPVFPAGRVAGSLDATDGAGTTLPGAGAFGGTDGQTADLWLSASAVAPRDDAPRVVDIPIYSGTFGATLPTGSYNLQLVSASGLADRQLLPGQQSMLVSQGELSTLTLTSALR